MTIEEMKKEIKEYCNDRKFCAETVKYKTKCPLYEATVSFCYDGEDEEIIKSNYEAIFGKPQFTLSDIKAGYLVKTRDNKFSIVIPQLGGGWGLYDDSFEYHSGKFEYNEDMTDVDDSKEYDIMEVYGESSGGIFNTSRRELLFKREEEPSPRDIKIKELQDKMDAIKREMDELK